MASSKPEVIIIGAGPVGLTAALELKRRGIHPRIIDKTSGPAEQSRALGVNPRTLDILEPSGVTHQLLAIGNRLQRAFIVEGGKTLFTLRIERLKHDRPFMLIVPQSETERILIHALQDRGVEVEWNTELMELSQFDDEVTAVIAIEDEIIEVTPDILIAADGAYSTARQCAGLGFAGSPYPVVFALADVHYQQPRDPTAATIELVSGGAVASFPMDAHTIRHVGTSGDVVSLVRSRRSGSEVIWDSEFHVSFRHVSTFNSGSIFLAGDAAHVPLAGRSARHEPRYRRCSLAGMADRNRGNRQIHVISAAGSEAGHQVYPATDGSVVSERPVRWPAAAHLGSRHAGHSVHRANGFAQVDRARYITTAMADGQQ